MHHFLQNMLPDAKNSLLPELHTELFCRHASSLEVYVLWRSTNEVNVLYPTRVVSETTENRKDGGVAAEVCAAPGLGYEQS